MQGQKSHYFDIAQEIRQWDLGNAFGQSRPSEKAAVSASIHAKGRKRALLISALGDGKPRCAKMGIGYNRTDEIAYLSRDVFDKTLFF